MKLRILIPFIALLATAFSDGVFDLFKVPKGWPEPHYDFADNPLTPQKIALGRTLFYDPNLSADGSTSCANCHSPYNAFAHSDHALSHGINDRIGNRNAPALMNLAWQDNFMWDGAIHHLDFQALAPLTHPNEMGNDFPELVNRLNSSTFYKKKFAQAYGDSAVTGERTLKAISQFLLTLVSCQSKYDSVQQNLAAFTLQEANGLALFNRHCNSCHTAPLFTNNSYENNGLPPDSALNDHGRAAITNDMMDDFLFKVPTLRNIEYTSPFMHDGRFKRLYQVLNHYTSGINHSPTLAKQFETPIQLSPDEKTDLIAFLLTLSDRQFLFNSNHSDPFYERLSDNHLYITRPEKN